MYKGPVAGGSAVSTEASRLGPPGAVGPSPELIWELLEDWSLEMRSLTRGCLF